MAFGPDTRFTTGAPGWGRAATADAAAVDAGLRSYMLRVYNWMASGLLLTGIVAYVIANSPELMSLFWSVGRAPNGMRVVSPTILGWAAMLSPLAFVLVFSFGINRMSKGTAQLLFWLFAAAMGASMSNIFLRYTGQSIATTFFVTSAMFAGISLYGYTTKADLTRMGSFMMMGLIGIVIASLVNIFLASSALAFAISIIGVVVFVGLTAWDTQRIKNDYLSYAYAEGTDEAGKRSVMDALALYLNFVNLFQLLLSFMGQRQSD
ncbi:Bax inhibitor-1/YccA family protein [Neoroseomonas oryzicola]|uniref:Bax inhibitor-1/YccA family protein n=1 Tax=Neoroseomonas oryzicola TaxID=535904 RepID=A0A9X9WI24_9PROT|nr:Bax inhibitor-1/YccA family protein [Neoroseomonas oryzicola]MBR0659984.1 Bax inhibitor-1/YccA family protein [Neoroseomonas oryzicola]NKE19464.1 Bax inhibitor-1/YccA family protein [Neoroseomonas oryzicola]